MSTVLASAADARYGRWLLNLVGSAQRRSDLFDRIVAYDLGLTPFQRHLLEHSRGVEVRTIPAFVPHWRQGFTWKTWIWTHLEADTIVWLDAGTTVLRPLTELLDQTRERGYFVVSQGVPTGPYTPSDYYELYDLSPDFADRVAIAAGILAFRTNSTFYSNVVAPTFEDAVLGRSVGFSAAEATKMNWGLGKLEHVVLRDCPSFRHDQTILNIHFYRSDPEPHLNDLYKYGGFRSPHDHPQQVIWHHRRSGDYRFLPRVRYEPRIAPAGVVWGTTIYARHQARAHRWLLRPAFYTAVARRLVTAGRLRSPHSARPPSSPK